MIEFNVLVQAASNPQAQPATVASLDEWFPRNHPGYELFPDGFPSLELLRVNKVSTKPLDVANLRETQLKLQPYLTEFGKTWWDTTLGNIEKEDESSCATCRDLRLKQKSACPSKTDDDDTKKTKSALLNRANKELAEHLRDEADRHPEYPKSILFPPSRFSWVNGRYVDNKEDTVVLDEFETELVSVLAGQREETENHFVGVTAAINRVSGKNPLVETGHGCRLSLRIRSGLHKDIKFDHK